MLILANSLVDGFFQSNFIGQGIVIAQLLLSVAMVAVIIGKWRELGVIASSTRRFISDFRAGNDVMEYYINRRPSATYGIECIYKKTCESLFKLIAPDMRAIVAGRGSGEGVSALNAREIELIRGTCDHALDEETIRLEKSMGIISTVVALSPMLGLLGTVWGVLDAFAEMGSAGSANLAAIAPSISSALVTTVVGLLIAIPGISAFNYMNGIIRDIASDMEGFSDQLINRIACEFQGRNS
jgi:biopolymer transport protein ExbB/TolQ